MIYLEARYLPGSHGHERGFRDWWTLLTFWHVDDARQEEGIAKRGCSALTFRIRDGKRPLRMVGPRISLARGKPLTAKQIERAKAMRAKGVHWQVIADLLQCCAPTVRKYLRGNNASA